MKAGRSVLSVVFVGIIGVVVAVFFMLSSLDDLIAAAIEKYGSQAVGTEVSVASVNVSLQSGEGKIAGLNVSNPPGFSSPHVFSLGSVKTAIDVESVTGDPVVINEIVIDAPVVAYEINESGKANVNIIKNNLAGAGGEKSGGSTGSGGDVNLVIRKLVIQNGMIGARIAALGEKALEAKLPRIELNDIGSKEKGATPAEVAEKVMSVLVEKVGPAVAELGVNQYLGKTLDEVQAGIAEKVTEKLDAGAIGEKLQDGGVDKLKGLFGQ